MPALGRYIIKTTYANHKHPTRALVLKGSVRVAAMDENGATFVDDVTAGDVWFFPQGVPHSLQALHDGCEFLLVFDSGTFSESNTFLATEMLLRTPKSVWAKDLETDVSELDDIPQDEKYVSCLSPPPFFFFFSFLQFVVFFENQSAAPTTCKYIQTGD